MKRLYLVIIFFVFHYSLFTSHDLMAQQQGMYFKVEVKKKVFLEVNFLLYLPEGYDKNDDKEWPLLLFLHGMGECGDFLELVKKNGPPMMIDHSRSFPFIVVSPQCPDTTGWKTDVLNMLLDEMVRRYHVDENCIWVTGLSMGGAGTWDLAIAYPKRFAAIVPVCGWTDPIHASKLVKLPIWVFHGAKDPVVPASASQNMVDALKALGSPVKFTLYPEAGHDAWTETYNDPELWEWMMGCCQ